MPSAVIFVSFLSRSLLPKTVPRSNPCCEGERERERERAILEEDFLDVRSSSLFVWPHSLCCTPSSLICFFQQAHHQSQSVVDKRHRHHKHSQRKLLLTLRFTTVKLMLKEKNIRLQKLLQLTSSYDTDDVAKDRSTTRARIITMFDDSCE